MKRHSTHDVGVSHGRQREEVSYETFQHEWCLTDSHVLALSKDLKASLQVGFSFFLLSV